MLTDDELRRLRRSENLTNTEVRLLAHIDDQQALIDRLVGMLEAVLDINTPAAAGISHHVIKTVDGTASVTYKCIPPGCRVCEIDRQARALLEEVERG